MSKKLFLSLLPLMALAMTGCSRGNGGSSSSGGTSSQGTSSQATSSGAGSSEAGSSEAGSSEEDTSGEEGSSQETSADTPTGDSEWYIVGSFNSWSKESGAIQLATNTEQENEAWTRVYLEADTEFKLCKVANNQWIGTWHLKVDSPSLVAGDISNANNPNTDENITVENAGVFEIYLNYSDFSSKNQAIWIQPVGYTPAA